MVLPTGTVTFLFTDIEGSTALWESCPDQMRVALARHDALLRTAIESHNGVIFKTIGDAFCAAFATAPDAVAAALAAQHVLLAETWEPPVDIRVRMGVHTGSVEHRSSDYFGPALNRVARLMSIGHGGQVLISGVTRELTVDHLPAAVELEDKGTHRLKDLGRPEEVYQLRHPDLPSEFRPLRSLGNPELPNNLPQQVTTFVGRERETADITRLLGTSRLVTLTAAGGTGKTRLSLQVAADLLDQYPDGVWLVELAALTEPHLVAEAIARVLSLNEVPDRPTLTTLTAELKTRRLLLILDNCEHLIAECARVTDALLRACSGITVLASSRQALNITGERVYALPALSLPDPKQPQNAVSLSQYDSVRLFVDRAVAVRSDFTVTNQNAPTLAHLCHRLDGIPLALELAAARVRVLSVEEINSRLDNRFRLLTGGSRNVLPRQQTLRALIDWSYDLLDEQERTLLIRLSVFVGGWSLSAAEQVCAGDPVEDWEIFDLLTALADKSLVVSDAESAEVRFRMLETLREYSKEKLEARGEAEAVAERHARYFAAAVEERSQAEDKVVASDFAWLMTEADNVRAALDWLWKADRPEIGAAIAVRLREFWYRKGWFREAFGNLNSAVARMEALSDKRLRAQVYKDAGSFALLLRDLDTAETLTAASVEACVLAAEPLIHAKALGNLAMIVQTSGDNERAEALFTEAATLLKATGSELVLADCLTNLGTLQSKMGKSEAAQDNFAAARSIHERQSTDLGMANWLCHQSDVALRQSLWWEAREFATQSVERFRQIDHRLGIAYALANLAEAASRQKEHGLTRTSFCEAVAICRETNHPDILSVLLTSQARSCVAQGHSRDAALLLAGAARLRSILGIHLRPEEGAELSLLETNVGAVGTTDSLGAATAQFSTMSPDAIISAVLAIC